MRSPHQIIMALAYALKEGKKNEEYRVADLSKKTGLHYMTTNDYLNLIEYVQDNIPKFRKIDSKGNARIMVIEELKMPICSEEKTLLNIFDRGAFSEEAAISLNDYEMKSVSVFLDRGDMAKSEDRFYLTSSGILKAAKLASTRAEKVTKLESIQEKKIRPRDDNRWKCEEINTYSIIEESGVEFKLTFKTGARSSA